MKNPYDEGYFFEIQSLEEMHALNARLFEMIIYWFFLKNVTFYFTKKLETRCK